jgi:predicted DNA-binding protein
MATAASLVHKQIQMLPEQHARLRELSRATRVPMSHYIRESIDLVLAKEEALLDRVEPGEP